MADGEASSLSQTLSLSWRLQAQPILFDTLPQRAQLIQYGELIEAIPLPRKRINIWRNHAFEPILSLLPAYSLYAGIRYDLWLSPYDDTFSFTDYTSADLECLWLDPTRYALDPSSFTAWIADRIADLRRRSSAPIVLATWGEPERIDSLHRLAGQCPAFYVADLAALAREVHLPLLDARNTAVAGTPLSRSLITLTARALACRWWAGALLPPIKAIAVDLDHTLHDGILAEVGVERVRLTSAHEHLQRLLMELQEQGILLALVSRNEAFDVEQLFEKRSDYPLRRTHFSALEVSWGPKSAALARIAAHLKIGFDALLFIDDNAGELYEAATHCPGIHLLQAQEDASATSRALANYPGLWRWQRSREDSLRARDLAVQHQRLLLQEQTDPTAYFRELEVVIVIALNPISILERLASLSTRTNQFNLTLRRLNAVEIESYMRAEEADVAAVSLSDRLSDSGTVGLIIGKRSETTFIIEELCLSCRALGRNLEDALILPAIAALPSSRGCEWLQFPVAEGPRNGPARSWLARLTGATELPTANHSIRLPFAIAAHYRPPEGIQLRLESHNPGASS
ncbi:MAG: HAD-IIIC family phosphatase [Hydrogenophilus sp.]|nr:HAD-IIIC family phosphatase [Hydrogenophilus sp.]